MSSAKMAAILFTEDELTPVATSVLPFVRRMQRGLKPNIASFMLVHLFRNIV